MSNSNSENQNSIKEYNWWGESNEPPKHLKTKKQLAEIGFKPQTPVGVICTRKYDLYLYDPNNPDSAIPKRKPTPAQLRALAKGRETQRKKAYKRNWYRHYGGHLKEKNYSIEWAKNILAERNNSVILDTETTGLSEAEIIQIAIIGLDGKIILDSFVKPTIAIPQEAIHIHGITDIMVENAPTFPQIYPKISEALKDKQVLIYNADFDIDILKYCCDLHQLKRLALRKRTHCLMEWYAQFLGEWNDYWKSYTWQPLGGDHNAVGDCLAALSLLNKMANSEIIDVAIVFENSWLQYQSKTT